MIPIRHASHDRLRRWRFRDRSNATGSVNIYISLHPDASSHDGSFYRGRHGPRQPLAHFAAFFCGRLITDGVMVFIDWRCLLQKRKLRVNFKILR